MEHSIWTSIWVIKAINKHNFPPLISKLLFVWGFTAQGSAVYSCWYCLPLFCKGFGFCRKMDPGVLWQVIIITGVYKALTSVCVCVCVCLRVFAFIPTPWAKQCKKGISRSKARKIRYCKSQKEITSLTLCLRHSINFPFCSNWICSHYWVYCHFVNSLWKFPYRGNTVLFDQMPPSLASPDLCVCVDLWGRCSEAAACLHWL